MSQNILMSKPVKAVPEGYHSVTPYLVVEGAEKLIDFVKAAFGAQEGLRMLQPDGSIGHTELRIGDSFIMLSEARGPFKAMPAMLYLYLEDVDAAYARALAAGATSIAEPKDQFYGDRGGGVQDMCGNLWWVGTRIEDLSEEELMRRHAAARAGH